MNLPTHSVKKFILENFLFTNNENSIDDCTSLIEKGIIDSTGILELVDFIENNYDIKVKDSELTPENFDSLVNIDKYITNKSKEKSIQIKEHS